MQVKLLQSSLWGEQKARFGWKAHPILCEGGALPEHRVLALERKIANRYSLVYIPYGFETQEQLAAYLPDLVQQLKKKLPRLILIRFDMADYFAYSVEEGIDQKKEKKPLKGLKKATDIQPPDTVWLSLQSEKEPLSNDLLLAQMHKKTRYNIKLAEKKGVTIRLSDEKELPQWYELYQLTAKRDRIAIHSYQYYYSLFELAKKSHQYSSNREKWDLKLYLAYHEEELLAGIIVSLFQGQATYLYGASSNQKRNYMPAYLLQWYAIQESKKEGALSYDFFGIPPANDPKHPMYGLYRFKTGFGGQLIHRMGAWDFPVKPFFYFFFRLIERMRAYYYRVLKK